MNLPSPFNISALIIVVSFGFGTAFAADKNPSRVNPFELPPGIYSQGNFPKTQKQTLKLEAVFKINGKYIATISGNNFVKGDFAFGKRVLNIFENKVVLDDGGNEEILVLQKSNFRLQTRNVK